MRKLFILILLTWSQCIATAQLKTTDSLRQVLAKEKEDTTRVMLLLSISRGFLYSNPDTALFIAQQAVELARKVSFRKGEMSGIKSLGNVLLTQGNYPGALDLYLQSLQIAEELDIPLSIASSLSTLADVYFYSGDIQRSIDYSNKAIAMYRKLGDSSRLCNVLVSLGDTYEKSNQLDSALAYTRLGYQMALVKNITSLLGTGLTNLGNVFFKLGKIDSAKMYYMSSMPLLKDQGNEIGICEASLGLARIFLQHQHADSSLYYAKQSFNNAQELGFQEQSLAASNFLADYYKSVSNVDSSYRYLAASIAAKDSLFSQQKANQVQGLTFNETMRHKQIEEAREQERVQLKQGALIAGVGTLLIVAFLLQRNNRQKRRANLLLQQQKGEINTKALELAKQKEHLEQSYNNVEQLGEIGRKITASLSVETIISTVYHNVNALMDAAVFGIGIYNDVLKRIEFPATYEDGQALPLYYNSVDDQNRFAARCFNDRKEIVMGDLHEGYHLYIQEVPTPHEGKQAVSLIYLPLIVKEKILGVITVQSFQKNAYSDYHLFMLRNIAIYTAIALENAESFATLNDTIETLKSTQSQLIQSEKMASLGELTAGIAHEIQNPLNFVTNFSEVNKELISEMKEEIERGNFDEVKALAKNVEDNHEKIYQHGKRADAIVKGMLQHSRATSSLKEPTDINALAEEYLRLSYHGLRAKDKSFNATLETAFDQSVGMPNIIPQDIGRVLLNLYNNAFYVVCEKQKTAQPSYKPSISVYTKKVDSSIEIHVRDNGNGINQKVIDKIFQPFFTTKPTGQGTGLGLSLSYDIMKAHGGEIRVKSTEGEGSLFSIVLPLN